jgi:ADP-ribose pyrophosphatase
LPMEQTLSTRRVYEGRVVSLRLDTIRMANGHVTTREIIEHGAAVAVVAVDDSRNVLLVRQYRHPIEGDLLEIPAGGVDPGEEPASAARRELQEETGFFCDRLEHLASFYSTPGFSTELMHLYLATGLRPSRLPADDDEAITVERVPLSRADEMISRGDIGDAKTLVGLLMLRRAGLGAGLGDTGGST